MRVHAQRRLIRAYPATLEVHDDGRTLVGVAVPYGVETRIGRYMESFAPGAFADAGVHTLTAAHPRDGAELPIGHSVELRDQADGLTAPGTYPTPTPGTKYSPSSATACPSDFPSDSCPAWKSHPRTARWTMRTRGRSPTLPCATSSTSTRCGRR